MRILNYEFSSFIEINWFGVNIEWSDVQLDFFVDNTLMIRNYFF